MWCKSRPQPEVTDNETRVSQFENRKCPEIKDELSLGIVVGHNARAQGAVNYLGESEYVFGKRIAKKIQEKLAAKGRKSAILYRPEKGGYRYECEYIANQVRELGLQITYHLHFNSASVRATGCEILIAPTADKTDNLLADYITDKLNERYRFKERGEDGVLTVQKGHRGYLMLEKVREAGAYPLILEPCFGHYRNRESQLIFEREDAYVDILVDAFCHLFPTSDT